MNDNVYERAGREDKGKNKKGEREETKKKNKRK